MKTMASMDRNKCDFVSDKLITTMLDMGLNIGEMRVVANNLTPYIEAKTDCLKPRSEELISSLVK
jgi:hypothetical protein